MNSRQLEYFLAVAHELNFTKAAESMYVSPDGGNPADQGTGRTAGSQPV